MFETKSGKVNRALVALTLSDGSVATVSLRLTLSNKLADALNGPDAFLDVLTGDGQQLFIARADVRAVRLVDVPEANQLKPPRGAAAGPASFDPYAVLKLARGAAPEDIREAYHRLSRLYHPDRLAAYELPEEMREYARVMQVHINLAFEQIGR